MELAFLFFIKGEVNRQNRKTIPFVAKGMDFDIPILGIGAKEGKN
jgi:hypothetical protein